MIESKRSQIRYHVAYGFGEGHAHGRYFHAVMRRAGFLPADSLAEADIIVAHSGGCYETGNVAGKIVFWFQPAVAWSDNAYYTHYKKTVLEYKSHARMRLKRRLAWKWGLNLTQLALHPRRTHRFVRQARTYRQGLPDNQAERLIIITNRDDPWSNRISLAHLPERANSKFLGITGTHDELWTNPEPYVRIIQATYEA